MNGTSCVFFVRSCCSAFQARPEVAFSGELKKWHNVLLLLTARRAARMPSLIPFSTIA